MNFQNLVTSHVLSSLNVNTPYQIEETWDRDLGIIANNIFIPVINKNVFFITIDNFSQYFIPVTNKNRFFITVDDFSQYFDSSY